MNILPTIVTSLLVFSCPDATCGLFAAPGPTSTLEVLVRQKPLPIGNGDSAEQKKQKAWYNYRLLALQRYEAIWCLDKRLSYEAARKLLDAEMVLVDGPVAVIRVLVKRLKLEAEAPPGPLFDEWADRFIN